MDPVSASAALATGKEKAGTAISAGTLWRLLFLYRNKRKKYADKAFGRHVH